MADVQLCNFETKGLFARNSTKPYYYVSFTACACRAEILSAWNLSFKRLEFYF